MYAHYYQTKTRKVLIISADQRPVGKEIDVSGRREAKAIAKRENAKAWNF